MSPYRRLRKTVDSLCRKYAKELAVYRMRRWADELCNKRGEDRSHSFHLLVLARSRKGPRDPSGICVLLLACLPGHQAQAAEPSRTPRNRLWVAEND